VLWLLGGMHLRALTTQIAVHFRWLDLAELVLGLLLWGTVAIWILQKTGSALPRIMMKRLRLA
jgi:hypothetical protein